MVGDRTTFWFNLISDRRSKCQCLSVALIWYYYLNINTEFLSVGCLHGEHTRLVLGLQRAWKKHLQVGYRLSNKLLLQVSPNYLHPWQSYSSTQRLRINVYYQIKFSMAIEFLSVFTTSQASNRLIIVFEVGKYHCWPNTLPFRIGYWGANTCSPGLDPSTHSSPTLHSSLYHILNSTVYIFIYGFSVRLWCKTEIRPPK